MQYVSWNRTDKAQEMKEYCNSDIAIAIDEYVHSERDREIMKRRLIDGLTYDELSAEFNLSARQLKNVVYKWQNKIFSHIHI